MRGITIISNNKRIHTGDDYDLVQEVKEISNPTVQSYTVEVPGRNGLVNLTKALTGSVCYYNRLIKCRFFGTGTRDEMVHLVETFNQFHGEMVQIIDDDTPSYFYEGEAKVSIEFKNTYVIIQLEIDAYPFRRKITPSVLTTGLTSTDKEISLVNYGLPVVPEIVVSNSATITFNGLVTTLTDGTYTLDRLALKQGVNTLVVRGEGTLNISFKEAVI